MKAIERLLIACQDDPVKYAMRVLIVLALALFFLLVVRNASAEVIFIGQHGEHVITLTNEPCALKAVTNMPTRATWREPGGRLWECCYGAVHEAQIVVLYSADATVQVVPQWIFKRARGI